MREELVQMFAATNLHADAERSFVLAQVPLADYRRVLLLLAEQDDSNFQTVIRAHDELAVLVTDELWGRIGAELLPTAIDQPWRLITLDVTIPLDVFGYLEQVARICAECEASMVVESDYSTDHIFVKADRFREVLHALSQFIAECRDEVGAS